MIAAGRIVTTVLLLAIGSAQRAVSQDDRPTVAVYPAVRGPAAADPVTYGLDLQEVTRRLQQALRDMRHFRMYERDPTLQQPILDEQDFARSERAAKNAARFGQLYNVALIVQPFISEFRFGP